MINKKNRNNLHNKEHRVVRRNTEDSKRIRNTMCSGMRRSKEMSGKVKSARVRQNSVLQTFVNR